MEIAHHHLGSVDVLVVPLASITEAGLVTSFIARAAGWTDDGHEPTVTEVRDRLAEAPTLLLLDNLEQIPGIGPPLAELVRGAPGLRVLATSRRALHADGEVEIPVAPLDVPSARATPAGVATNESVALLVQTARRSDPAFAVTAANAADLGEICRRLDGLPLALELAAARLRLLAPSQLVGLLGHRLDLLRTSGHPEQEHHRALRATIQWSVHLLSLEDQARFCSTGVLGSDFGVDVLAAAADADVYDVLDTLEELLESHLVRVETRSGERRFSLLETTREFALDELDARHGTDAAVDRLLRWCVAFAASYSEQITGSDPATALDHFEREMPTLRSGLQWGLTTGDQRGLILASSLWRFWLIRGHVREGRSWLERLLAAPGAEGGAAYADALHAAGELAESQSDYTEAARYLEAELEVRIAADDDVGTAESANALAYVARGLSDLDRAEALHEQSLAIMRRLDRPRGASAALNGLAAVAYYHGDLETAAVRWAEARVDVDAAGDRRGANMIREPRCRSPRVGDVNGAVELHVDTIASARELNDVPGLARALGNYGEALVEAGQLDAAAAAIDEALSILGEIGEPSGMGELLDSRARLAERHGDVVGAVRDHAASIGQFAAHGPLASAATATEHLAVLLAGHDEPVAALRFLAATSTWRERDGSAPVSAEEAAAVADAFALARSAVGRATAEALQAEGSDMTPETVAREAVDLVIRIGARVAPRADLDHPAHPAGTDPS